MGPLKGVRVLEIGAIGPAPFTAMMLADMGADVVRVDRVDVVTPAPGSAADFIRQTSTGKFSVINRSRRSIGLDLKSTEGREVGLELVAKADVLIEGFRPGVMERLGLGPDICLKKNPALVFGRMTGWGQTGPLALTPGHDPNYVAIAGAMHLARFASPDTPPKIPAGFGDFGAGGMFLAFGIMCALFEAKRSGKGQVVDAAICDGTSIIMAPNYAQIAAGIWNHEPESNTLDGAAHFFSNYECADGKWISIAAIEPQFYADLIEHLGVADNLDFQDQMNQALWPKLKQKMAEIFKTRTRAQWTELLEGTDACFAPILDLEEATQHPQLVARNRYVTAYGVTQPAPAPVFSRTSPDTPYAPPEPGAHTQAVLRDWGVGSSVIEKLQHKA